MELNQAKEIVASMATRDSATYIKRVQTPAWDRVYELAGKTSYTKNGIMVADIGDATLEYWDGESIDLSGLVVKYTGDNAYSAAVEKDELDDICTEYNYETTVARIESDDTVVDNRATKRITISAIENPDWTAEVEITVKKSIPDHFIYDYPMTAKVYDDNVVVLHIEGSDYSYDSNGQSVSSNNYHINDFHVGYTNGESKQIRQQDITVSVDDSHNVTITYSDEDTTISDNIDSTYVGSPLSSLYQYTEREVVFPMGTKFTKASDFNIRAYYDYDYPEELRDDYSYHTLNDDECTVTSPDTNTTGTKFVNIKCNANNEVISLPILITGGDIPVTVTSNGTTLSYEIDPNDLPTGYELSGTAVTLNDGTPLVDSRSNPIELTGTFGSTGDNELEVYVNESSYIVSDLVSAYGWYRQPIAKLVLAD